MGKPWIAMGVRVFADEEGLITVVPPETEFEPGPELTELHGIRDIDIEMHLGEPAGVRINAFASGRVMTDLTPEWIVLCPDGRMRTIKRVHFKDGSQWTAIHCGEPFGLYDCPLSGLEFEVDPLPEFGKAVYCAGCGGTHLLGINVKVNAYKTVRGLVMEWTKEWENGKDL